GERIIYHRLIKNRLELFACHQCEWEQAGTRTPGQDDAFHSMRKIDFGQTKGNAQGFNLNAQRKQRKIRHANVSQNGRDIPFRGKNVAAKLFYLAGYFCGGTRTHLRDSMAMCRTPERVAKSG